MSRIDIEGTFNLRDVGGLPVAAGGTIRSRLLYRGDALDALSDAGITALRKLQLRTIIDLREPVERRGQHALDADVQYTQIPILRNRLEYGDYEEIAQLYTAIIDVAGEEIAKTIARLAEPKTLPALVHCTAGKDRTGLVVGLLLAALGVPDDAVAANYALTAVNFTQEARARALKRALEAGLPAQKLAAMVGSPPQLMLDALEHVRATNGTVPGYLTAHGLHASALADLRQTLIDVTP
jgi:protein-tyrosine phosphatase